ncbi:MAG: hypothetical protein KAT71_00765 [Gammaproteobacteria bacterium]|nr:hypothetical protein [Gammaproteobacteria bacterium]
MYQQLYLTITKDGSFNLLPYLPNKKYFAPDTKIFELPEQTPIQYLYKLIGQQVVGQNFNVTKELD